MGTSKTNVRGGFTLIELVIVLAILAALAGLIIPRVDFLKAAAESASGASGLQETMSILQLYKTVKGRYPGGMDSLLEVATSTDTVPTGVYTKIWYHPPATSATWLQMTMIPSTGAGFGGLAHGMESNSTGLINTYFHNAASTNYSDSATVLGTYSYNSGSVATVVSGSTVAKKIYPQTAGVPPTGTTLVALGVGANNSAVGVTMASPPQSAGSGSVTPATNYCRFIAIFAVTDSKCNLKAMIDPLGNDTEGRLAGYYTATPE